MSSNNKGIEFFVRIILVTAMLIQYLTMPLSAIAASLETDDTLPPTNARQQVEQLRRQSGESDEAYLERFGQSQPEMFQSAAMLAVQEALNGRLDESTSIEAAMIQQIDHSIDEALADPEFGLNIDGSYDETGAYNWESHTFSPAGDVTGAWAMQATLDDDIDRAAFEAAFEEQLEARSNALEPTTTEPAAIEPTFEPEPINANVAPPQPFAPFALSLQTTEEEPFAGVSATPLMTEGSLPEQIIGPQQEIGATEPVTVTGDNDLPEMDVTSVIPPLQLQTEQLTESNPEEASRATNCTLYVNDNATGANNGSSWHDAYTDVRPAVEAAKNCQGDGTAVVNVAAGAYTWTYMYDRIQLYGGFNPADGSRDWQTNKTTVTGIIMSAGRTAWQHLPSITNAAVIDGLYLDAFSPGYGEGIKCNLTVYDSASENFIAPATECSPTIRDIVVENYQKGISLEAQLGGGYQFDGDLANAHNVAPSMTNVTLRNNSVGIFINHNSASSASKSKIDVTIDGASYIHNNSEHGIWLFNSGAYVYLIGANVYDNGNGENSGAGVYVSTGSSFSASGSNFYNNQGGDTGGAIYTAGSSQVWNSTFLNNSATSGGAIFAERGNDMTLNVYSSLFGSNTAQYGGGLFAASGNYSNNNAVIVQSTFANNHASQDGGGLYADGNTIVENSLFWDNVSDTNQGHQLFHLGRDGAATSLKSVLIPNGTGDILNSSGANLSQFDIFSSDPYFVDPDGADNTLGTLDDNYRLQQGSPAIERGGDHAYEQNSSHDRDGQTRTYDDPVLENTYGSANDVGAYELHANSCDGYSSIYYVTQSGAGDQSGRSWSDANANLSRALQHAAACQLNEVRVAGGVYTPGSNTDDVFRILPDVKLYGGYDGSGATPDNRDYNPPTVLSGDIDNNDVSKTNGITADHANIRGNNSRQIVIIGDVGSSSYVSSDTVLDGLVVTGADALAEERDGGGISCVATAGNTCSPTLSNLQVVGNRARHGGGLLVGGSGGTASPTIENTTFSNNKASGSGGGVYMYGTSNGTSSPTFTNVDFTGNEANQGGGVRITALSSATANPTFTGGSFVGNQATNGQAGAIYLYITTSGQAAPTFTDINIADNSSTTYGGALAVFVNTVNASNTASASPTFEQVQVVGNSSTRGGAIYHHTYGAHPDSSDSDLTFVNSTIANNTAILYGGGIYNTAGGNGGIVLNNTIIADNKAGPGTGGGQQIVNITNGNVQFNYSLVPSNTRHDVQNDESGSINYGTGVVFGDPLFTDAANGDWRLLQSSPAIDTGNNSYLNDRMTQDRDGNPRTMGAVVDMGAYEFTPWVTIPTLGNVVNDLAVASDGTLYAAEASGDYVSTFDGTSWSALTGLNAAANALYFSSDSTLYAGGDFTDGVARWTGSAWEAVGSGFPSGTAYDIIQDGSGTFYVAGDFGIYRLDGGTWQAIGNLNNVRALAFYNGSLYAGGHFNDDGGAAPDFLARWDGSAWQAVLDSRDASGVPTAVNALAVYAGQLAIGTEYNINIGSLLFWDGSLLTEIMGVKADTADAARVLDFHVSGSQLAIVGNFDKTVVGNVETAAFDLAVWTGTQFISGAGGLYERDKQIQAVVVNGGDLYAGGEFASIGGRNTPNVGLLRLDTVDLSIGLTVPSQAEWPGTTAITLTVDNQGTEAVDSATVGVWLPSNISFGSSSATCAAIGQLVNCQVDNVQPNTQQQVSMTLNVVDGLQDPANISAFVGTAADFDATPTNNVATQSLDLTVSPDRLIDLGITLTANATEVNYEEVVSYTVTVANTGTGAGRDVLATVTLPSGGAYQGATHAGCTLDANRVLCDLDQIDPDTSRRFEIGVQMNGNGFVTAQATVADQSTETSDDNPANNSVTGPGVTIFAEGRVSRQVGNVVIAANSFTVEDGKVRASGAVELGALDDDGNPNYTIRLTAGLDYIEWLESVEGGEEPPEGEPALNGRGLVTVSSGNSLFIGDFQIADADDPVIAAGEDLTAQLDEIESFEITGTITYTGITLADGVATLEASIAISPRGITTTAQVTGQLLANDEFSGTISSLTFMLSSLEISAENVTIADGTLTVDTVTITLSESLGGAVGTASELRITPTSISLGGVGAQIPLPDINIGDGTTIRLTELKATVGYFRGTFSLKVEGVLNLSLPDNIHEMDVSLSINSDGEIAGSVSGFSLDIAGAELKLEQIAFGNSGLSIETATLILPASLNGATATIKEVSIGADGLSFGSAELKIPLPDILIRGKARIHKLMATVEVVNDNGDLSFALGIEGKVLLIIPKNAQSLRFTATMKDGSMRGTIDKVKISMMGSTLVIEEMVFEDLAFTAAEAKLTLPAVLQNSVVTVTDVKISKDGLEIGGGSLEVPLPDIAIGGESAVVQLALTNGSLIIAKASNGFSLTLKGKVRIAVSSNTAEATGSLTVNWSGELSGELESFTIEVVGMEFRVEKVKLQDGIVQAELAGLTLPAAFGGLSTEVYDLRIGNGEFEIGGGSFKLPEIRVASFLISVEGRLQRESSRGGSQYIITAKGKFKMAGLPTTGPGCSGLGVSLTVYVNTSRELVMEVTPIDPSTPELDQARAGITGMGLRNVTIEAYCRIPITGTGFSLTRVFGSLTLNGGTTRIELGVTIETDFQLLGAPAIRSSPTLGIEKGPGYFQLDFKAAVEVFAMFEAARAEALIRIGQKSPGGPSAYFSATLWIDIGIIEGRTSVTAWSQNGFHLVGHGSVTLHFEKGFIFESCFFGLCLSIPPFGMRLGIGADFGEFKHGSGTAWGVKGYAQYGKYQLGAYIDSRGTVDFGNVANYHTITPPDISRAAQLHQEMSAGRLSRAVLSAEDQRLVDTYRFTEDATLIDLPIADGDLMLTLMYADADQNVLEVRLIRPDGLEITMDNLPGNMELLEHTSQSDDGIPYIQKTVTVAQPVHGLWKLKLIGADQAAHPYILDVKGSVSGPKLSDVTQTRVDDSHVDVSWAVSSQVPTTTINIYATAGPITTTQTITPDGGLAQESVIDLFSGATIAENVSTTLDGSTQTAQIDFSGWESGEYWVWVDANDTLNPPTREYAPGKIIVEHPWQTSWTANTVITTSYRTLDVRWDTHSSSDVDTYHVYLTPDGDNFLSNDTRIVEVGDANSTLIEDLRANTAYAVKVVAIDLDTERESHAEISRLTVPGAPFTVSANPTALTLSNGMTETVALQLTAAEEPFPVPVILSVDSQTDGLVTTVATNIITPTLAGATSHLSILASPLAASGAHTVTIRASAAGDVRYIDIPVMVQQPTFELHASPTPITLTENATATVDISATYLYGESDDIFLTLSQIPTGLVTTFDQQLFGVGEQGKLILSDTNLLTNGTYTLPIVGLDGDGNEKRVDVTLVVDKPTFTLNAIEGTEAQAAYNSTVRYTVHLEGDGWDQPVSVDVDDTTLSGYLTPTIQLPARALLTPPATFEVVVDVADEQAVPAAVYEMVLVASSNGVMETLPLQLAVGAENAQPDVRVSYELSSVEVNAGDLVTLTTRYENRGSAEWNSDRGDGFSHSRILNGSEPLLIPVDIAGCDDLAANSDTNGFDGTYRCDAFGTLQPGDSFTLETVYRIHEGAEDGAVATIAETVNVANEFDADDNKWSANITVRNTSDVTVALNASAAMQNAGENVTYTAVVGTNGNADAAGATVTFTPDEMMHVESASPSCSVDEAGTVTCTVGAMASGCERATASSAFACDADNATTQTVAVTVKLDPATTGDVTMNVAASSTLGDSDSNNNSTSATTTATASSALNPILTAIVEESAEAGTHSHTLVITNDGPSVARNVTVDYTLPANASYKTLTVNGVSVDKNNAKIVSGVTLAPTEAVTVTMEIVHMQDTAGVFVDSTLTVSANGETAQAVTLRRKVNNVAPTVAFGYDTLAVNEGESIRLTAIATDTTPLDEASPNWSVDWDLDSDGDFDDATGNVAIFDAAELDGTTAARRAPNGEYEVAVRVTDGTDASVSRQTFTVRNVAPTVDAGSDQLAPVIDTFTLNATFADPASADTHTAVVKWGDGTQENVTVGDNALSASHRYDALGTYNAQVCVSDDDGGEGCDVVQLQASCLDHGLVTRGLSYHFDNRTLIATTNLNYIGTLLPNPLPEAVDLTLYNGETAIDTINVEGAFAANSSQAVQFEWAMAPLDTYTLTVKIDDDGTGNAPLSLCVSGAPEMDTNTGVAPQAAPPVGESRVYGPTGVTIGRTGGDDPGMITVTRSETNHADADYVDLMWSIAAEDEEGLEIDLEVCYTDGDLSADQQANEARLILYHRHEPTDGWDALVSMVDTNANCVSAQVTQFSDFLIGLAEPNAITLESFTAKVTEDGTVMLDWVTSAEFDHAGFNVYRTETAQFVNNGALNAQVIPSSGIQGQGGVYALEDTTVENGVWFYWLEDVDIHGKHTLHGPVELNVATPTAVTVRGVASASHAMTLLFTFQIALGGLTLFTLRWYRRQRN